MTEQEHRDEIVRIGRRVHENGWVAANDGNLTVRLDGGRILATPTGVSKGMLTPEMLLIADLDGRVVSGERAVTSELDMHLAIYRARADVRAVVHAHPPVATGFAVAGRALDQGLLPEVIVGLGWVPLAPYALPGGPELAATLAPYIGTHDAILLANHGAIAYGPDLLAAYMRMETVELLARITLAAELAGGARRLPRVEIQKLFEARGRYGVVSRNRCEPGVPLAAEDED